MLNVSKKIAIIGTGGFAKEVYCLIIDIAKSENIDLSNKVFFIESDEHYKDEEVMGIKVLPQSTFKSSDYNVVVAIGNPAIRKKVVQSLPAETTYITLIHPKATLSSWVTIGEGSIITDGTIVTCNINIGKHAHLNLHTTIGHDFTAGDFFTTAPAVNISGNCTFGNCVYFGTNASTREGINICDDAIIGMGAVVVKNIVQPGVYVGSPAVKLNK